MSDLALSVLASLDGTDPRLFPYLPELLLDLDDLGASPALIEQLPAGQANLADHARMLDLGCGKGSVALRLLQRYPWTALGLAERCRVVVADIRDWAGEGSFEVSVLEAVGPVLGDSETTLRRLDAWLAPGGRGVMDAVHVPDGAACRDATYNQTRSEFMASIARAGFRSLAGAREKEAGRADDHRAMFEAYVANQAQAFEILEQEVVDVTLLLGRA